MSNYILFPPTPSFLGIRIKTKGGIADPQVKTVQGRWKYVDKDALQGNNQYLFTIIDEAYKAGYRDGMRRPVKDRKEFQEIAGEEE